MSWGFCPALPLTGGFWPRGSYVRAGYVRQSCCCYWAVVVILLIFHSLPIDNCTSYDDCTSAIDYLQKLVPKMCRVGTLSSTHSLILFICLLICCTWFIGAFVASLVSIEQTFICCCMLHFVDFFMSLSLFDFFRYFHFFLILCFAVWCYERQLSERFECGKVCCTEKCKQTWYHARPNWVRIFLCVFQQCLLYLCYRNSVAI